jgi:hypothetical protein
MCGCKDRQKLLGSAVRNAASGNIRKSVQQARITSASAIRDAQKLARQAQARILQRPR